METKIIGVTPLYCDEKESIWMLPGYMDMLREAGLLPIILPTRATPKELNRLNGICDGYLFTGGHDVDPALYGAEKSARCGEVNPDRDALEQALFRLALDTDKPILGICRGIQLINAVLGGTLYQDLETERISPVDHHMHPSGDAATGRPFVCHSPGANHRRELLSPPGNTSIGGVPAGGGHLRGRSD